ncbi:MAG TPA: DUF2189 domain-containing protein [Thauera sp.]|nr:DUF2189 domain-containing protein [Thauera sp.]
MSAPARAAFSPLKPAVLRLADISSALCAGWRAFRAMPGISMSYAAAFAVLGAILFAALESMAVAPLSLSFAGGFMLIGPALLAGFFALADRERAGQKPVAGDIWQGFRQMPRGGWVVSFVCALLFLIWITDASTLYGFMIGREPAQLARMLTADDAIKRFVFFSSMAGAVLAFILFAVSAFSIPLIYDGRADLVSGVVASVRAVFSRFGVVMAWACLLATVIIISAIILPLLLVTLPVMAYASRDLYFRTYPRD